MARLIPGRIRNEGNALSKAGKVEIISTVDKLIKARVDGVETTYAFDDDLITCQCDLFAQKNYCEHLAAVEHYLKNSDEGKTIVEQFETDDSYQQHQESLFSFGSLFLDGLSVNEDDNLKYRLSVSGNQDNYSSDIWWTLYINRLPDNRRYVIRDIKSFLSIINQEGYYQIGKNYYESLSYIQFDQASQELIDFLNRLIPDEDLNQLEFLLPNRGRNLSLPQGFFEEGLHLMQELYDFQVTLGSKDFRELYVKELEGDDGLFHFKVEVHQHSIELIVSSRDHQSFFNNSYLIARQKVYHLNHKQQKLVNALSSLPIEKDLNKHVHFDFDDQGKLAASLLDFAEIGQIEAPKSFTIRDFKPKFDLDLSDNGEVLLQMTYDYDGVDVSSKSEYDNLPFASNFKREARIKRTLENQGFIGLFQARHQPLQGEALYQFFSQTLPRLSRLGEVTLSDALEALRYVESPKVAVTTQPGLLDVSFDFSTVYEADIDQALAALMKNDPYFISESGRLVVFDEETKKISQTLQHLRAQAQPNGHLQLSNLAAFQLSEAFQGVDQVDFSANFKQLAYDLTHPQDFDLPALEVEAVLRDYQVNGVRWMSMLNHYGFGGILADDMGLGKTLQTISFLKSQMTEKTKALILAPSSLIYNWKDEFSKFSPDLDVAVAYGSKPERLTIIEAGHQVLITSYASFRQDFSAYRQMYFDYLIMDEAQVLKNTQTKIAQNLREFEVGNCFALSGTPIENKLLEIWSIFQIVLPGLLPAKKAFLKLEPKEVAQFIKPFVLRRKKEEVLPELPDLTETTYYNELADDQKAIYLAQLRQMQDSVRQASDSELNSQKIQILAGITRLRQICDTPALFMDYAGDSGKLDSLHQLLTQIKESGKRTLIFSQFRDMLTLAQTQAQELGLGTYMITGSTPADQRQEMTKAFNNGSKDVFLVSLKAGGVGLNLTGADTVVLIDLWWNPAVEMQAISRAHRLGQQNNVEVFRLITRGTIEEKILELQETKKNLVSTVLDGGESRSQMTIEEIKEILGIRS